MQPTQMTVHRVTSPAGDPAWRVRGYETFRQLLTDPRLGRSHPASEHASRYSQAVMFGRPMASPANEQEEHAAMRRLLTPSFSALRPRVQGLVDDLLEAMGRMSRPVDAHEAIAFPLPALVICELLGVPAADREDFRRWSDDAADMTDAARSMAGWKALWRYMRELIERKQQQPGEDVLSDLIAAHSARKEALQLLDTAGIDSASQIAPLASGLLFAGHETTVAAIDKGIVLLLTIPIQREALQHDPTLVPSAVEEILRHPLPVPAPEMSRTPGRRGHRGHPEADEQVGCRDIPTPTSSLLA